MPIPEEERRNTGLEFATRWGTFRVRGLGTVLSLSLVAQILIAYSLWGHTQDTTIQRLADEAARKAASQELSDAIKSMAHAQREFSCLIAAPQETRERAWESGKCRNAASIGDYR